MFFHKMARNAKRKLAIFAGTSKCLIYAEAKYCASEMPGEIKYYECSRTEYCCAFGCCVSPGPHFHHLWYYWILVIIMFLVCSGGGWWYRYWLQSRYRAAASAIPNRSSNSRTQNSLRGPTCQAQQARISYNSARNTVLLHRMWKGPQRNGAATAYSGNATTSAHYQNMSVVLNDANCPYYQLYGPPPSYETVIAQSRGKVSSPASPENARINLQQNPSVPQCFSYPCNPSPRLNGSLDQGTQCQNGAVSSRQLENHEIPFAHFSQYCTGNGTVRQNLCIPFEYQEQPVVSTDNFTRVHQGSPSRYTYTVDKSSDNSDPENTAHSYDIPQRYTMLNIDCVTSGTCREQPRVWEAVNDQTFSKVHGKPERCNPVKQERDRRVQRPEETRAFLSESKEEDSDEDDTKSASSKVLARTDLSRKVYGGSLKSIGRYTASVKCEGREERRVFSKVGSHEGIFDIRTNSTESRIASREVRSSDRTIVDPSPSESNPSSNVILDSFVFNVAPPSIEEGGGGAMKGSTNFDLESKHRLDRSKSLD